MRRPERTGIGRRWSERVLLSPNESVGQSGQAAEGSMPQQYGLTLSLVLSGLRRSSEALIRSSGAELVVPAARKPLAGTRGRRPSQAGAPEGRARRVYKGGGAWCRSQKRGEQVWPYCRMGDWVAATASASGLGIGVKAQQFAACLFPRSVPSAEAMPRPASNCCHEKTLRC